MNKGARDWLLQVIHGVLLVFVRIVLRNAQVVLKISKDDSINI